MSDRPERGAPDTFEVTWVSGYVECLDAHQVSYSGRLSALFGESTQEPRIEFHGEFDGHWLLVLSALQCDIRSVRNVTRTAPDFTLGGMA